MSELSLTNNDLHKIIDDAMEKRDRTVNIYIMKDNVSISVRPASEDDGMKWIREDFELFKSTFQCSCCGVKEYKPHHYCPECGAERTGIIVKEEIVDKITQTPEITLYKKGEDYDQN